MKQSIVLFILAGFALVACSSPRHFPTDVHAPDDKLAEIQARGAENKIPKDLSGKRIGVEDFIHSISGIGSYAGRRQI